MDECVQIYFWVMIVLISIAIIPFTFAYRNKPQAIFDPEVENNE